MRNNSKYDSDDVLQIFLKQLYAVKSEVKYSGLMRCILLVYLLVFG